MNRIQFLIVTSASGLLAVLLLAQILLVRQSNFEQNRLIAAQQFVTQAQGFQGNLKQLAVRIYQVSQQTQDQGLKDLLARQQINFTPNQGDGSTPAATPAPDANAPTH